MTVLMSRIKDEKHWTLVKVVLTFCEAHSSDGWVAEHHGGDAGVVQLGVFLALKQPVGQLSPCGYGNWPRQTTLHR